MPAKKGGDGFGMEHAFKIAASVIGLGLVVIGYLWAENESVRLRGIRSNALCCEDNRAALIAKVQSDAEALHLIDKRLTRIETKLEVALRIGGIAEVRSTQAINAIGSVARSVSDVYYYDRREELAARAASPEGG